MSEPEGIYTLETAAERLGVRPEVVRHWIEGRGLRALPLGDAKRYRPRSYLIRETWLLSWLDANSRVATPPPEAPEKTEAAVPPKRTRARKSASDPLNWECPV